MSEILTIDLKELEEKVENGKGLNHTEATVLLEFVRKIISNGGTAPQPQLTIPGSIAKLINTGDTEYIRWTYADELIVSCELVEDEWKAHKKLEDEIMRRKALVQAYLAGKALGVDLVKVVEG